MIILNLDFECFSFISLNQWFSKITKLQDQDRSGQDQCRVYTCRFDNQVPKEKLV